MTEEIWKDAVGFEGYYWISNLGNVKSIKKEKLVATINTCGYFKVTFSVNSAIKYQRVHRLVATAFIPNPENKCDVNHIDGNKLNNHVLNLEWATRSENTLHSIWVLGKKPKNPTKGKWGALHPNSHHIVQISLDGFLIGDYGSQREAARETGIRQSTISACISGKLEHAGGYVWR